MAAPGERAAGTITYTRSLAMSDSNRNDVTENGRSTHGKTLATSLKIAMTVTVVGFLALVALPHSGSAVAPVTFDEYALSSSSAVTVPGTTGTPAQGVYFPSQFPAPSGP